MAASITVDAKCNSFTIKWMALRYKLAVIIVKNATHRKYKYSLKVFFYVECQLRRSWLVILFSGYIRELLMAIHDLVHRGSASDNSMISQLKDPLLCLDDGRYTPVLISGELESEAQFVSLFFAFSFGKPALIHTVDAWLNHHQRNVRMFSKQVSFIVDHKGNRCAAVVPIDIYDELMILQKALNTSIPGERELYYFCAKNAEASGYPVGESDKPGFMVLSGSRVNTEEADSLREAVISLRQELLGKGVLHAEGGEVHFTRNHLFNSPSLAASLIAGNNRSGLDAWCNKDGFTLKQSGFGKK